MRPSFKYFIHLNSHVSSKQSLRHYSSKYYFIQISSIILQFDPFIFDSFIVLQLLPDKRQISLSSLSFPTYRRPSFKPSSVIHQSISTWLEELHGTYLSYKLPQELSKTPRQIASKVLIRQHLILLTVLFVMYENINQQTCKMMIRNILIEQMLVTAYYEISRK